VLMFTGLIDGKWRILTPDRIDSFQPIVRNLSHMIMLTTTNAVQNLAQSCSWGILCKWVNLSKIYLFN